MLRRTSRHVPRHTSYRVAPAKSARLQAVAAESAVSHHENAQTVDKQTGDAQTGDVQSRDAQTENVQHENVRFAEPQSGQSGQSGKRFVELQPVEPQSGKWSVEPPLESQSRNQPVEPQPETQTRALPEASSLQSPTHTEQDVLIPSSATSHNRSNRNLHPLSLSFAQATDITDVIAKRRRLQQSLIVMRVLTGMLIIAAIVVAGFPIVLQLHSAARLSDTSTIAAQRVAGWPYPQAKEALAAARAYNKRLAISGQPVLGEAVDPFSTNQGASKAKGKDSVSAKDSEYQALLDAGDGVMGTIRIPQISVDLPIYHGTSEKALASGAGHLYGTSLPVGGKSTHSVITGHRGLVNAMMFTRLDELKAGDFFYIEVMGQTLGYEVDRISVIEPDDTSLLRITPGEDRVTLMTCTPYGINTQRLLVSGHREPIPVPAPDPRDLHDARTLAILTVIVGTLGGWLIVAMLRCIRRMPWRVVRHATFWPQLW